MSTPPILVFIEARLDEAASMALSAAAFIAHLYPGSESPGEWKAGDIFLSDDGHPTGHDVWADDDPDSTVMSFGVDGSPVAQYIARNDPDRELRQIDTKRRLVQLHGFTEDGWNQGDDRRCTECGHAEVYAGIGQRGAHSSWPCATVRLLAAEWNGHPGYEDSWTA